ncbi:MAG: YSC84-related protein [Gammaproteobacteria bacterium]|jgi:lipid-binding SYLF domain-containing protein|nr:YSC84-related protein [Gammaproteobacteria bacterium]
MLKNIKTIALMSVALMLSACATAPGSDVKRQDLRQNAQSSLQTAKYSDSSLTPVLEAAVGYAVYPSIGKGAVGVGGAYGRGILYENGVATGYTDLSQATIGFQLGGQKYTEILVFNSQQALGRFKFGELTFSSQATAVALKSGAGANAKFKDGVAVFTMDEQGLMFEASIGGQKFNYQPF